MKKIFYLASILVLSINSNAQTWKETGPVFFPINQSGQINGQGRVTQLKFHPTLENKLYATSASGGLYYSQDTGHVWTLLGTDNFPVTGLASICIDHTNDQTLYIGTGDPNYYSTDIGVYKSINGGATWTSANTGLANHMALDIIMHPTNNQMLVIATNNGIWKTTNAAGTWTNVHNGDSFTHMIQIPNTNILLAGTNNSLVYRSTDFGSTWVAVASSFAQTGADGLRICVNEVSNNIVYVVSNGNNGVVYKSTNSGITFTEIYSSSTQCLVCYNDSPTDPGQGNYNFGASCDPLDPNHLYVVAHCLWESIDGGVSWLQKTEWYEELHTDHHQINISPYNNNVLWNINDGGVWQREGTNDSLWKPLSDGITAMEMYKAASSPKVRKLVSAGTQDNGEVYYDENGWFTNRGGDWGSRMLFDYSNENNVYYLEDGQRRSFTPQAGTNSYNSPFITTNNSRIAFNKVNNNISLLAKDSIWFSANTTSSNPTWTMIHPTTGLIRDIVISSADNNIAYAINNSNVIRINNLLSVPTMTTVNVPATSSVRGSVATIKNDVNVVYISCNNKMYRSADQGVTWTNVTYNLPTTNILKIQHDDFSTNERIYVCSGNKIFTKIGTDVIWTNISTNLPTIANITDFMLFNDSTVASKLRVSYYGRGVWEYKIHPTYPPTADFNVNNTLICEGKSVTFNNTSVEDSLTYSWTFSGGTPATSTLKNPTVTYNTAGNYTVSLTVTSPYGSNTKSITNYIQVISQALAVEGAPGMSIELEGSNTSYLNAGNFNMNTNTATFMCWIKPNGPQNDLAGLIFARGNSASGISIKDNNEIRYHWDDNGYGFSSGLFASEGQWSHCALVVSPTSIKIYVNGVAATNNVTNSPTTINDNMMIGADISSSTRRFKGMIDEVCIYNKALTQNEIREQMHLVKKNNILSDSLKGYYQMNAITSNNTIVNKANCENQANTTSTTILVNSTAPFGSGTSERKTVTSGGIISSTLADANLTFPTMGTLPNGEICINHITEKPDQMPSNVASAGNYWIIDNYGTNQTIAMLSSIELLKAGFLTGTANQYSMYNRSVNADGATWSTSLSNASSIVTGANGSALFGANNNVTSLGQFVLSGPYYAVSTNDLNTTINHKVYPNPATNKVFVENKNSVLLDITVYTTDGKIVTNLSSNEQVIELNCKNWSNSIYYYTIKSTNGVINGRIEISK
jgi:PKD repeat protein